MAFSWVSLFFFCFFLFTLVNGYRFDIRHAGVLSPDTLPSPDKQRRDVAPFKPSNAVIVGVLTTMFFITFLLLLYVKHCKRGREINGYPPSQRRGPPASRRKNSGIDTAVIGSLPIFRFGSLQGQKDGLECAVCLSRFESTEILRLLPKCKHAFHVECVDTWLDAHSTCPLCRNRVDPEDILLVEDGIFKQPVSPRPPTVPDVSKPQTKFRRVSGRHSSAGEAKSNGASSESKPPASCRRSVDSVITEKLVIGCFERPRKDGMLLTAAMSAERKSFERRFEHRIIISNVKGPHQRWSDVQPSDLLHLQSEKIISDNNHRFPVYVTRQKPQLQLGREDDINTRSVSEITGLSRFAGNRKTSRSSHNRSCGDRRSTERHEVVSSRWRDWLSLRNQTAHNTAEPPLHSELNVV